MWCYQIIYLLDLVGTFYHISNIAVHWLCVMVLILEETCLVTFPMLQAYIFFPRIIGEINIEVFIYYLA